MSRVLSTFSSRVIRRYNSLALWRPTYNLPSATIVQVDPPKAQALPLPTGP